MKNHIEHPRAYVSFAASETPGRVVARIARPGVPVEEIEIGGHRVALGLLKSLLAAVDLAAHREDIARCAADDN